MLTAEKIRNAICKVTEDGAAYKVSEIKEKLFRELGLEYGIDYTEGVIAGSLAGMEKKGILRKLDRGIYQNVKNSLETSAENGNIHEKKKFEEIYADYRIFVDDNSKILDDMIAKIDVVSMSNVDADRLKRLLIYKEFLADMSMSCKKEEKEHE